MTSTALLECLSKSSSMKMDGKLKWWISKNNHFTKYTNLVVFSNIVLCIHSTQSVAIRNGSCNPAKWWGQPYNLKNWCVVESKFHKCGHLHLCYLTDANLTLPNQYCYEKRRNYIEYPGKWDGENWTLKRSSTIYRFSTKLFSQLRKSIVCLFVDLFFIWNS